MKDLIKLLIALSFISIGFCACGDDEEETAVDLFADYREVIGYWSNNNWGSFILQLNPDMTCRVGYGGNNRPKEGTWTYDPDLKQIYTSCEYTFTVKSVTPYLLVCVDQYGKEYSMKSQDNGSIFECKDWYKLILGNWQDKASGTILTFTEDWKLLVNNGTNQYECSYERGNIIPTTYTENFKVIIRYFTGMRLVFTVVMSDSNTEELADLLNNEFIFIGR
ncbi:MAG: hypothetical protein IJ494_00270 [Bacteroides sp.]|nr:hypothetical protein [Bacteroides sp.]